MILQNQNSFLPLLSGQNFHQWSKMNLDNFSGWLEEAAREIGAHSAACIRMDNRLLRLRIEENNVQVANWLKLGMHGEMDYLERMLPEKSNPWTTFPFAKSVIVLAFTNRWGDLSATHPFPAPASDALLGYLSAYARETDYHLTGQTMLSKLTELLGENIHIEATVDTAAVYERLFATVGGLGVVGINTLQRQRWILQLSMSGCLRLSVDLVWWGSTHFCGFPIQEPLVFLLAVCSLILNCRKLFVSP